MTPAWTPHRTGPGVTDGAEVRRVVDDVLRDPAYGRNKGFLQRLWSDFVDWFLGLFDGFEAGDGQFWLSALQVLGGVLIVACIVLGVWLITRRARARTAGAAAEGPSGRALALRRAAELRLEARRAREAGDLLLSLRLTFFALVVGLGENGDLVYRPGWTNRELFERGEPRPEVARALSPLVAELDARSFGGVPVLAVDVERFEVLCEQWLDADLHGGAR